MLSCDTSVAVGSATFDGSVIFAKNSDRPANECQPLQHAPRKRHPAGATLRTQNLEVRLRAEAATTEALAADLLAAGDRLAALVALRGPVDASTAQAVDLARALADELEPRSERLLVPAMVEAWRELDIAVGLAPAEGGARRGNRLAPRRRDGRTRRTHADQPAPA